MTCKHILLITFSNEPDIIVKWLYALLCNRNNFISVICLHTYKWMYMYDL